MTRFFRLLPKEVRKKQINDLCTDINHQTRSKPSSFALYPHCNEKGWHTSLNKIAAAESYAVKVSRVALLVGESNLLSILPEVGLHADIILCNDINSDLNRYTQFLVQCLVQSSTRKDFEEHYKKHENGRYCNPLSDRLNIDEQWENLTNNWIFEKHFLASDERFALCKEQLSKLKIVWHNANLFNTSDCLELSKILKKHQASITLVNVTNLHMYLSWYKDEEISYRDSLELLLNDSPSPIILYSVGFESYTDGRELKSRTSFGTEGYFSLLDTKTNSKRWEAAWYNWSTYHDISDYKDFVSENLTQMANIILKKLAIENDINLTYLPSISFNESNASFYFNFNAIDLPSQSIPIDIRPKLILLLKGLLGWTKENWFEDDDFFEEPRVKLNGKQKETYCLSLKDRKIYYQWNNYESMECKIVDPLSFSNLIHEIENNEQFKKIKHESDNRKTINKVIRVRFEYRVDSPDLIWFIEKKAPDLKELFIKCIGRSRFELSQFDQKIDLFSLAWFVKQHMHLLNINTINQEEKLEIDSKSFEQIKECFRCVFESDNLNQNKFPFVADYDEESEEVEYPRNCSSV